MDTITTQSFGTSIVEAEVLTQRARSNLEYIVNANHPTTPDKPTAICLLFIGEQELLANIQLVQRGASNYTDPVTVP